MVSEKFGTGKKSRNRYRKNLVPEKVSEPVSEKFGTGKRSRNRYRKNLVPELIFVAKNFEFRRFIMGTGTGTGNFSFFLVVSEPVSEKFGTGKKSRNRYRKNLVPEKSPGTGIGKIWYRKKVSEPVSEKFGTGAVSVFSF